MNYLQDSIHPKNEQTPEEIQNEIENIVDEMEKTLGAIQKKFSPAEVRKRIIAHYERRPHLYLACSVSLGFWVAQTLFNKLEET